MPDPTIQHPTDAIIEVTSSGLCGSDLHLYETLGPFMGEGDVLGHEPMGIVREVGAGVTHVKAGDRVVIPFQIACGDCWMCNEGLPDERFLYLSDVLPTAWQAVKYAGVPDNGTVAIMGLGPIGDMANRISKHLDYRVIGVDLVPERLERVGVLPKALSKPFMSKAGVDRLAAFYNSIDAVRRGGTISLIGVYGGMADPVPMLTLFDKQIQLRMGQANVKRWADDILPLLTGDDDPLGVDGFATHRMPLSEAPQAYEQFQKKQDGTVKVVFKP